MIYEIFTINNHLRKNIIDYDLNLLKTRFIIFTLIITYYNKNRIKLSAIDTINKKNYVS